LKSDAARSGDLRQQCQDLLGVRPAAGQIIHGRVVRGIVTASDHFSIIPEVERWPKVGRIGLRQRLFFAACFTCDTIVCMRIPWTRLIKGAVLLAALGFLAALVHSQWTVLQQYEWRLAPGWALAALIGIELAWLFEAATWRMILTGLGGVLPIRQSYLAWFLSNILRYIPGNIWQFLGMAELAHEDGVPRLVTLTSIVLHQVISTAAGVVLAACFFALFGNGDWLSYFRPLLLMAPLGLFLLQPQMLERALNWLLGKMGRPSIRVSLSWRQIWALVVRYLVVWLLMGLSFAALVRAVTPVDWPAVAYLVASWAAAYAIGYLTLLTPAGLGVREGALTLLLFPIAPPGVAAVIALVARLWMVLGEVLAAAVVLAVRATGRRRR